MTEASGYVSSYRSLELASTLTGASSFKTRKIVSKLYEPMSPRAPQPKSLHPRQTKGKYAWLKERSGAGPSQRSQSKPSGTASASFRRSRPWGQKGRLDQFMTSRTGPIAPSQIHSHSKRVDSDAWLPTAI